MAAHALLASLAAYVLLSAARGLNLDELYSFGERYDDTRLRYEVHKLVNLSTAVMFNGEKFNSLHVNSNGAISFNSPLSIPSENFANGGKSIAPFYTVSPSTRAKEVFYRESREKRLLLLASAEVHAGFAKERMFKATSLFIATWLGVENALANKTISFQVVLISDGKKTFALFHYVSKDNKQMHDGQISTDSFPKAGFNFGEELSQFLLPNSGTAKVGRLCQTSNVNFPGKWLYMIGSQSVGEPDVTLRGSKERTVDGLIDARVKRNSPDACGRDALQCSEYARCNSGCCVCNSSYYGDGKMCLKTGQPIHLSGDFIGSINGISVDGIRFSVFGDVQSKTTHVALDQVSPQIGFPLRVLTPLVSTLGFLFAYPGEITGNGFSFLGDNFLRRCQVTFETGEETILRERMLGKDGRFYKFQIEVSGNVPVLDATKDIKFDNYIHTYRYDRLGTISGYYRSAFNVGDKKYKINVVEALDFDEVQGCMNIGTSKMDVSEQRSTYNAKTKVLNFALKTEMQDQKACGEEKRKCHRRAKCVVKNGLEFCSCNIGFQGDGFSCKDVDECLLKIHECSPNADCINSLGAHICTCRDGYQGDGKTCIKEEGRCGSEAKKCHSSAQCVTKNGNDICECNLGYVGDGVNCEDTDECLLDIHRCSVNADCSNTPGSYECSCKEGYAGDGKMCRGIISGSGDACTVDGQQCDPSEECIDQKCQCRNGFLFDGNICKDANECQLGIHTCDKNASCFNTVGSYTCTCNAGFTGDGYKCVPNVLLSGCHGKECHDDGYCDRSGEVPVCRCKQGFNGDGFSCEDVDECNNGVSDCHGYAYCTNTRGSYTCQCRPGYVGNGRECVYDNPCEGLSCSVFAGCIERNGVAMCQCFSGYYGDGKQCQDYNECEAKRDSCDDNARCVNTAGSYKCFCSPGYVGDGFSCKSDGSCGGSACHRNAECVEVDGVRQCRCIKGFVGSGLLCVDFDECANTLVECPQNSRCFNIPGSYQCRCDIGYRWNGAECEQSCAHCLNGGRCVKSGCVCREGFSGERCQWVDDEFLVFAQGSTMQRLLLPPTQDSIGVLLQTTRGLLMALDFDYGNKMIYFTDVARKAIWRVAFNGTGTEKIISEGLSSPEGIAVDYVAGNLYWTDSMFDRLEVSKLDGSDRKVLFSTRLINPRSIVVHPEKGTMYWADWNRQAPKIEVAHMDGGSRRVFIQPTRDFPMGLPNGLTLDRRNEELCWTDAMYGSISCAKLNERRSRVVFSAARYPFGITSFGQYLIWTDWDARTIQQYNRQSYRLHRAIKSFPGSTGAFYEIKAVQKPDEIGFHECTKDNGGCSSLCLSKPGGRTCACANGYYLVRKEDTLKLRGLGSGMGSGSGLGSGEGSAVRPDVGLNETVTDSGTVSGPGDSASMGSGSGSGSGSGPGLQSGPTAVVNNTVVTSINSTMITSTETVCVDEETYKALK